MGPPSPSPSPGLGRPMIIVALIAVAAGLVGLPARATYGARTSADEPQYLLTATSLATDGDLDIADEVATASYLDYHEVPIDRQAAPRADGRRISPHDPLLPLLLAGPMAVGGWVAAKAFLALVAGVTAALTLWTAVRRLGVSPSTATVATASAFAGIPLAAYGGQVYPEMPAALALLAATAAITSPTLLERRRPAIIAVAAIVTLPWLGAKYVPVAAVAGLVLALRLRASRRALATVIGAAAMAAVAYLLAHRGLYGGWTVYASGDHFADSGEFGVIGTDVDLLGRARRLSGLLVDGVFGLAVWSPAWLVLPVAVGSALGRLGDRAVTADGARSPDRLTRSVALALLATTWVTATFVALTMHGWWVPGRQLVVGLPAGVLLIATWADASSRRRGITVVLGCLGAIGATNWIWLAIEAATGRRTLIVDFAETGAPAFRALNLVFPDGVRDHWHDTVLLAVWTIAVLGATAGGIRRSPRPSRPEGRRASSVMVRR